MPFTQKNQTISVVLCLYNQTADSQKKQDDEKNETYILFQDPFR